MDIRKIAEFILTAIGLLLLGVWKLFLFFLAFGGNDSETIYDKKTEDTDHIIADMADPNNPYHKMYFDD